MDNTKPYARSMMITKLKAFHSMMKVYGNALVAIKAET
jgi:hypothetical protein